MIEPRPGTREGQDIIQLSPKNGVITFLDWDDTILCTTYLRKSGIRLNDVLIDHIFEFYNRILLECETIAYNLIVKMMQNSFICIVTASEAGWVQMSCKKFYPKLYPLLDQMFIISAKSAFISSSTTEIIYDFEEQYRWKKLAMEEILYKMDTSSLNMVISIGDGECEKMACKDVVDEKLPPHVVCKTIKLKEQTNYIRVYEQLIILEREWNNSICNNMKLDNLDFEIDLSLIPCREISFRELASAIESVTEATIVRFFQSSR